MPQAPLVEIFRYAASGVVFLFYLYIADPCLARGLLTNLGEATVAVGALALGALTYIVYRVIIFAPFITRLRDRRGLTYRTWLRDEYKQYELTRYQAVLLYALVRPELERERSAERATHFANVHYSYMASLLAFPAFLVSLWSERVLYGGLLLVFGILLFITTLEFHKRGEDEELLNLTRLANKDRALLDNLARIVAQPPAGG